MAIESGETTAGREPKAAKPHKFLGSLRDALMAAGREDTAPAAAVRAAAVPQPPVATAANAESIAPPPVPAPEIPSAEEAARIARTPPETKMPDRVTLPTDIDQPPTTRVIRPDPAKSRQPEPEAAPRTILVRGKQKIEHGTFERDPVVGFLIVVGGPGLGSYRPIFEGNNTVGRSAANRIPLDFGDETISNEAQAYVRYDSSDRSFLFVPNLAKTNVVSVNDKRPAGPVPLHPMDVITFGRTQVAFLPFCGSDFDWSEISEA
ncbi:FHA domain-containing protein [Hyphomicrobium sp.]|uniref:FHA domain-containing protein n=1 Tax=Hyphomicrobium sp. TaxID=82 RepID=UPI002D775B16|nr:FHA domain-containing protein [Hyphomicrobium sp.]HET6391137.1 FHA domain-containing protein [Hyphomicrobium sp.]